MALPPADPVLYLALVNSAAKDALWRARQFKRDTPENLEHYSRCRMLYAAKAEAAARLAYAGELRLGLIDNTRQHPAALLIGYSPALGYHAFHLPLPPHRWATRLPRTSQRSPYGSAERLMHARQEAPPLDEVLAALAALPPLPRRVAVSWGLAPPRPSWPAIEAERASAPGGVPRKKRR